LLDVESHLAKVVLALANRFGDHSRSGQTAITLKLSQQELASMVGATRELVNRRLRAWPIAASSSWSRGRWSSSSSRRWRPWSGTTAAKTTTTTR